MPVLSLFECMLNFYDAFVKFVFVDDDSTLTKCFCVDEKWVDFLFLILKWNYILIYILIFKNSSFPESHYCVRSLLPRLCFDGEILSGRLSFLCFTFTTYYELTNIFSLFRLFCVLFYFLITSANLFFTFIMEIWLMFRAAR